MSTILFILQRGRVSSYRDGALTSIVRNGRVLRRPRLPSVVTAKPVAVAQHGDAHERF